MVLTELAAVNEVLRAGGLSPVSSLEDSGFSEAAQAHDCLKSASRNLQTRGWSFNTELGYPLLPDVGTGYITLPRNTLLVDPTGRHREDFVQRGLRLYDRHGHTYSFKEQVMVDLILMLTWDELPTHARALVVAMARRDFQSDIIGSSEADARLQRDLTSANTYFLQAESDVEDANIFTDDPDLLNAVGVGRRY